MDDDLPNPAAPSTAAPDTAAPGAEPQAPSTTEDVPATPGWVEGSVDEILFELPQQPALASLRNAYLDCLAAGGGAVDLDNSHDRCRRAFLAGLEERLGVDGDMLRTLELKLEALEAEITDRI